jgi:hypothetical protein
MPTVLAQPIIISTASASLTGTLAPTPVTVDPAADTIVLAWDISNHKAGDPAIMVISADISLDGGATWQFLISGGRDKGYDPIPDKHGTLQTMASVSCQLPGIGVISRQIRATLSSSSSVITSITATQSAKNS